MSEPMKSAQHTSTSGLRPAAQDSGSTSMQPRMRRMVSSPGNSSANANSNTGNLASRSSTSLLSSPSPSPTRGVSPIPSARIGSVTGRNNGSGGTRAGNGGWRSSSTTSGGGGLLDSSWAPSWASVQDFATSLLAGGDDAYRSGSDRAGSRNRSKGKKPARRSAEGNTSNIAGSWGPEPPNSSRPRLEDVAAGAQAERDAALRALRTASVLESHDGVNSGLDVSGKFKKRRSDEDIRSTSRADETEEQLVYIHHVQPSDTYAGIVVKYRCREDAFRKANGLWSRDNIQVRKWLAMPVDACEVRGRSCEGPAHPGAQVDLLAPTPDASEASGSCGKETEPLDDFFAATANKKPAELSKAEEDSHPWTHVRWVSIDSFTTPVEIARVSRTALGYFPPRRKKTLQSASTASTPRGSTDIPSIALSSEAIDSPGSTSSRRHSLLGGGHQFANAYGGSTPASSRSRVNSGGGDDLRPAWMRRPGGVGSMGKNVRAPGPEKDYFNSWAKKHIPSLNIDSFPSMSVMGSEIARFGINGGEQPSIVESSFEEGRDLSSPSRQGLGIDKAAAAVETWLRSAFAKRPGTPNLGPRGQPPQRDGDLIELTDTNSDDGRGGGGGGGTFAGGLEFANLSLLSSSATQGSSSRSAGEGTVRGRSTGNSAAKVSKDD